MAGGAALATTIDTCACVLICGLMPVVLVSLRSRAMRRFSRPCLADVVGTLLGLAGVGALVGIVVNALIVLLITLLIALVIC
jgi:hypothetical protein